MVDDHEVMSFLGSDLNLSFGEIPEMLMKTEAGFNLGSGRYRPAYYLTRLIETATWGVNPHLWYSFRVVLLGTCFFISWHLLGNFFGVIIGGLSTAVIFSRSYWADIWAQLGPAEAYCVAGVALYLLAYVRLWNGKKTRRDYLWWSVLTLSAILAMGSKENLLLLLPFSAVLLVRAWRRKRLGVAGFSLSVLIFSFGLFIAVVVVIALRAKGADLYLNPVTPMSRLMILANGLLSFEQLSAQLPLWISLIVLIYAMVLKRKKQDASSDALVEEAGVLFMLQAVFLVVWYSQYVFYNGKWPTGIRYDFPGVLSRDLAYIFLACFPLRILNNGRIFLVRPRITPYVRSLVIGVILLVLLTYGRTGYATTFNTSRLHSIKTKEFAASFSWVVKEVKKSPRIPIIVESHDMWDYERVLALREFFSAYGVTNPLALKIVGWSEATCKDDKEKWLSNSLHELSDKGELDHYRIGGMVRISHPIRYYPLHVVREVGSSFIVSLSGEPVTPGIHLGRIW